MSVPFSGPKNNFAYIFTFSQIPFPAECIDDIVTHLMSWEIQYMATALPQ